MKWRTVIMLTFGLLAMSGCSSDETSDASQSAAPVADEADSTDDATGDGGGETVEVPSDFAIPTVDGAVVVIDSLPGIPDGAYLQLLYPGDRYEELVQFYDAWIGEQSVVWSPTPPDTSAGAISRWTQRAN